MELHVFSYFGLWFLALFIMQTSVFSQTSRRQQDLVQGQSEILYPKAASISVYTKLSNYAEFALVARLNFPACVKAPATIIGGVAHERGQRMPQQEPGSKWALAGKVIDKNTQLMLLSCENAQELHISNYSIKFAPNIFAYGHAYIIAVRPFHNSKAEVEPERVEWKENSPFYVGGHVGLIEKNCDAYFFDPHANRIVERLLLIDEEVDLSLEVLYYTTQSYTVVLFCDVSEFRFQGIRKSLDYFISETTAFATHKNDLNRTSCSGLGSPGGLECDGTPEVGLGAADLRFRIQSAYKENIEFIRKSRGAGVPERYQNHSTSNDRVR